MTLRLAIFSLICTVSAMGARGQTQAPLEAYGQRPDIVDMDISPDGQLLAALKQVDGVETFVIMDLDGMVLAKFGADNTKSSNIRFLSNDRASFSFGKTVTRGYVEDFEVRNRASISVATNTGNILLRGTKTVGQQALDRVIAVDDTYVYMPAFYKRRRAVPATLNLYAVHQVTGLDTLLHTGTKSTVDWYVAPNRKLIIREDREEDGSGQKLTIASQNDRTFRENNFPLTVLGFSEDEKTLIALAYQEDMDFPTLTLIDVETGETRLQPLDTGLDGLIQNLQGHIIGFRKAGLKPSYYFFDANNQSVIDKLQSEWPAMSVEIDSFSEEFSSVLLKLEGPAESGRYVLADTITGTAKTVGRIRPSIPAALVSQTDVYRYAARDGTPITAIRTLPPYDISIENTPIIILPHGGPAAYDTLRFDWLSQYIASRGYIVLQPNFRGSKGFGATFERLGRGEWGRAMQTDLEDGLNALRADGYGTNSPACIIGASYGGYAALAAAAFEADTCACAVAIAPVSDLNRMLRTERRSFGRNHWVVSYWENAIANGQAETDRLSAISPADHAEKVQIPVLLIHGKDDTIVPLKQSEIMAKALKKGDKPHKLIVLEGGDHWLSFSETRIATLREIDSFLTEYLPTN